MNANATTESAGTPELLMPQALLMRTAERLTAQYDGIVSEQTVEQPSAGTAQPRRSDHPMPARLRGCCFWW
ncbi:hypothetical protein [Tsukamurella tyrosinosolvens]|uniref:hypothetical protein n=1 Tax=Tsukamurella TaxID=2060 RepID=UPI000ACD9980